MILIDAEVSQEDSDELRDLKSTTRTIRYVSINARPSIPNPLVRGQLRCKVGDTSIFSKVSSSFIEAMLSKLSFSFGELSVQGFRGLGSRLVGVLAFVFFGGWQFLTV